MNPKIKLGLSQKLKEDEFWPQIWQIVKSRMGNFPFELLDVTSEQEPCFIVDMDRPEENADPYKIYLSDSWINFYEHFKAFKRYYQPGMSTMDSFFMAELLTFFCKAIKQICKVMVVRIATFSHSPLDADAADQLNENAATRLAKADLKRVPVYGQVRFIRVGDHDVMIICKDMQVDGKVGILLNQMHDTGWTFQMIQGS